MPVNLKLLTSRNQIFSPFLSGLVYAVLSWWGMTKSLFGFYGDVNPLMSFIGSTYDYVVVGVLGAIILLMIVAIVVGLMKRPITKILGLLLWLGVFLITIFVVSSIIVLIELYNTPFSG